MAKKGIQWDHLRKHEARLFNALRDESAATASLLSVMKSVDEFGNSFMRRVGGKAYKSLNQYCSVYCEVTASMLEEASGSPTTSLSGSDSPWGTSERPDGIIVVSRGGSEWKALVEVKVGANVLNATQIKAYHKMAKHFGFDALVTVSNQAGPIAGHPPADAIQDIHAKSLKSLPVVHIQWQELLADATALHDNKLEDNVSDEDQRWILGQWIHYLNDAETGILGRPTLGKKWTDVLSYVKKDTLSSHKADLKEVIANWHQLSRKIEYELRIKGVRVERSLPRGSSPADVRDALFKEATDSSALTLKWKCKYGPVDNMKCQVQLGKGSFICSFDVDRFEGTNAGTKIGNWLKQIEKSKREVSDVVVDIRWKKPNKNIVFELKDYVGVPDLKQRLEREGVDVKAGRPLMMTLKRAVDLGRSGREGANHIEQISAGVDAFYSDIIAGLRFVETMPVEQAVACE